MSLPVISSSVTSRRQAITDMIESVALQQTALAHILNAEGEKLHQRSEDEDGRHEDFLATTKSVESMIGAITRLEIVLQSKLALFEDCLCGEHEHCPHAGTAADTDA